MGFYKELRPGSKEGPSRREGMEGASRKWGLGMAQFSPLCFGLRRSAYWRMGDGGIKKGRIGLRM